MTEPVDAPVRLRRYRPADAPLLAALYRRSVEGIGPRDYAAAQVAAWASLAPSAETLDRKAAEGRLIVVATDRADTIIGFGALEPDGHVEYLYCAPEGVGTGAAHLICAALEREARVRGIPRLSVEASEAAKRVFLRRGYTLLHRRDLMIGDVPIHNFAMAKTVGA